MYLESKYKLRGKFEKYVFKKRSYLESRSCCNAAPSVRSPLYIMTLTNFRGGREERRSHHHQQHLEIFIKMTGLRGRCKTRDSKTLNNFTFQYVIKGQRLINLSFSSISSNLFLKPGVLFNSLVFIVYN